MIKNNKKTKIGKILLTIIPIAAVLVAWEYASNAGLINRAILPAPTRVLATFRTQLESGIIEKHVIASGTRVITGFIFGSLAGIVIGILMGLIPTVDTALSGILGILRPIPIIALIPFFILWLGIGEESKIAVIVLGSFWPVLINTAIGIKSTDKKLLELAKVLNKNYAQILINIVLPSALTFIISGIRLAAGNALVCVVTAEMIAASSGVGYMIMFARELSQADVMLVGVIIIGVIGFLIDRVFLSIESKLLK